MSVPSGFAAMNPISPRSPVRTYFCSHVPRSNTVKRFPTAYATTELRILIKFCRRLKSNPKLRARRALVRDLFLVMVPTEAGRSDRQTRTDVTGRCADDEMSVRQSGFDQE